MVFIMKKNSTEDFENLFQEFERNLQKFQDDVIRRNNCFIRLQGMCRKTMDTKKNPAGTNNPWFRDAISTEKTTRTTY